MNKLKKEKLKYLLTKKIDKATGDTLSVSHLNEILEICDWYADEMIKLLFEEENEKNEGKIKVRTEKGIMMLTKEELDETQAGGTMAGGII